MAWEAPGPAPTRDPGPPLSAPAPGPPPQGLPEAAAAAPVIQVACPEARRPGAAGTTGGGASPQPGPPTGRSARREAEKNGGPPGRGALGLLIPLKVTDQRRSFGGRGGAGEAGAGAGSGLGFPLLCGLGSLAKDPGPPAPGKGAPTGLRVRTAGPRESPPSASPPPTPRASLELPPPWRLREGCLSPPHPIPWPPREQNEKARHLTYIFSFNLHSSLMVF